MGLRKVRRNVAKAKMKTANIKQPNKTKHKNIDDKGNPIIQTHKSFFSMHWREG